MSSLDGSKCRYQGMVPQCVAGYIQEAHTVRHGYALSCLLRHSIQRVDCWVVKVFHSNVQLLLSSDLCGRHVLP